jgi:hypothetical protein
MIIAIPWCLDLVCPNTLKVGRKITFLDVEMSRYLRKDIELIRLDHQNAYASVCGRVSDLVFERLRSTLLKSAEKSAI